MKKKLIIFLCIVLAASMFGACNNAAPTDETDSSGGTVKVHIFEAGFGTKWLENIAREYKAATGITVKITKSFQAGEIGGLLNTNQQTNDIVMPLGTLWNAQNAGLLEDITSVYDAVPEGETDSIKDKMNQNIREKIETDGKYFQMNWVNSVSGLCYNESTLDKFLGEGQWSLPLTTNELFALCDRIKAVTDGPYAFSTSSGTNYFSDYMGLVWWAQYQGYNEYYDYYSGYYTDVEGNRKFGTNEGEINGAKGRKVALDAASKILKLSNGYMHKDAKAMSFEEAQIAFVGQGFGTNKKEAAFMINGDWLENEMQSYLAAKPQDIKMMRAPVISEIIERLDTVKTDIKLAEVVKAVDEGKTYTDLIGVSETDFKKISDARKMTYTASLDHPIGVVKARPEKQKELAKNFLIYLCSNQAQRTYAKTLGGITMPYGYIPDTASVTGFAKSRIESFGNDMLPICVDYSSVIVYRGGLTAYPGNRELDYALLNGTSSETILSTSLREIQSKWNDVYLPSLI